MPYLHLMHLVESRSNGVVTASITESLVFEHHRLKRVLPDVQCWLRNGEPLVCG